jgi:hypothetical protein
LINVEKLAQTTSKEIRRFGIIGFSVFTAAGSFALYRESYYFTGFFGFLGILTFLLALAPGPLRSIYIGWMRIAGFIGQVLTGLVLTLMYFLVITPYGFASRIFGKNPLGAKINKASPTYWVKRTSPAQSRERFTKRY